MTLLATLALAGLGGAACAVEDPGEPPPIDALHFPTGLSLADVPGGAPARLLFVVSSNFDLRWRAGVLHAFDADLLDQLADAAPPPADCPAGADGEPTRCRPPDVPDVSAALVAAVEIDDFGGQVAAALLPDRVRAFVPSRGSDAVTAVDLPLASPQGAACAKGGGTRCEGREHTVKFPLDDPYSVAVVGPNVYVTHTTAPENIGVVGAAEAGAPLWQGGEGKLKQIWLGPTAGGGVTGRCRPGPTGEPDCAVAGGTVYVSGRSPRDVDSPIYVFDFPPGDLFEGGVYAVNAFYQQRGLDSRGVALATGRDALYVCTRFPDAVAMVDVTRVPLFQPEGCVVPADTEVPADFACPPGQELPEGRPAPKLATARMMATPRGPTEVFAISRTLPDGRPSDLLAVTTGAGVVLLDERTGELAGELREVGSQPSSVAWTARPDGSVRLYVTSFGRGTLAIVDLADPFDPRTARVVARMGRVQVGGF